MEEGGKTIRASVSMVEGNKLKLKMLVKELEAVRGRHTELVSVYIPAGYSITDVINQLKEEQGTASNIKSKTTRKNVLTALERIIQHLKIFKQTPPNGLIVFAGNVSPVEGKEEIKLWSLEPPIKMKTKIYWCDQTFVLEPLKEMLREREVYGLIVLDAKEANIGLLVGKSIEQLKHLRSTVMSKTVKGGMCLSPDTLIQLHNGRIVEIRDLCEKNNPILSSNLNDYKTIFAFHNNIMKRFVNEALRITTKAPTFEITVTPEHRFFIPTRNGFDIVYAKDLRQKDDVLVAKKIETDSALPRFNSKFLKHRGRNELLLYQIIGYIFGDGTKDVNRIIIYDKDEDIIDKYKEIAEKLFKVKTEKKFRKRVERGKSFFEVKIYSKELMETIDKTFFGIFESEKRIHPIIQKLPLKYLARFIGGLFDAEGYVDRNACLVGIAMSTKSVIKVLQLMLLRFGVLSSFREELYKGKYHKYHLRITDYNSVKLFKKHIKLLSKRKTKDLREITKRLFHHSYANQVPVKGSFILNLARELRMNIEDFPQTQDFFYDKKRLSFEIFKKMIIRNFKQRLKEIAEADKMKEGGIRKFRQLLRVTQNEVAKELGVSINTIRMVEGHRIKNKNRDKELTDAVTFVLVEKQKDLLQKGKIILDLLHKIAESNLCIAKIYKIQRVKTNRIFYDISIPVSQNFLANGIVVHNSQRRFDRLREEAIHEFLTKVGEQASNLLLEQKALKGVIIGGPGPIKERFASGDYLNYQIKNKLLGVKDTSYTGEYGLQELVHRSEDLLAEASVVHERQLLEKFFTALQKEGLVTYGTEEVCKALEAGAVDTLLISEAFDWQRIKLSCQCGYETEKDLPSEKVGKIRSGELKVKCEKCRGEMEITGEKNLAEVLTAKAEQLGTKIEFISTSTTEGEQFEELGGIGALLRFKV